MALEINDIQISSTATKQGKLIVKRHSDTVDPTVNDDSSAGYDMGDRWMNSTSDDEFVLCDASVGAAIWKKTTGVDVVASDMPGLQMKRTTDDALTDTPANVTFDLTPFENDTDVLEHDNTNTDRMHIKETGAYLLGINLNCDNSGNVNRSLTLRLRIDDTTTAATLAFDVKKSTNEVFARTIPVTLTAGTYVTVDAAADSGTDLVLKADSVIWAVRMSGKAGATGAQGPAGTNGADGDITWEGVWVSQNYVTNQAVEYQGSSYVCHTNTTSSQVPTDTNYWDVLAEKGDQGPSGSGGKLALAFSAQNKHGLNSTATVYTVMASCLFTGTDDFTPSIIKCCVNSDGTGNTQWVKIYDVTNSQTIAEGSWAESTSLSIQDLGTLSNLSTGPAHWEIQMKIDAGTNQFNMYNMTVY